MNQESLKSEVLDAVADQNESAEFERFKTIVRSDLEALNLQMSEGAGKERKIFGRLWENFNSIPKLKRAGMTVGLAGFLGGCSFSLIDVDVKGGLKLEPYRPPAVHYESLPSYSKGRGHVDSGGGTGTWHGYGTRDGKVKPIWEEQGSRSRKKK